MASRKPHLTATEVESLDLFDKLREHLDEQEDVLLAAVVGPDRDGKRRFRGKVRSTIYRRDGGQCWYCGSSIAIDKTQIDHVVPWSRGGRTIEINGVASCAPCNRHKSNRVW
jgi:hypothetical protein